MTDPVEEYDEFGEIRKPPERTLSSDQKHRIHQTKDLFDGECYLCQRAAKEQHERYWSYWGDDI